MKTLIITLLFTLYTVFAFANTTQNNTSGSNTSITGGYTTSTTYESGSSSSSTTTKPLSDGFADSSSELHPVKKRRPMRLESSKVGIHFVVGISHLFAKEWRERDITFVRHCRTFNAFTVSRFQRLG